MVFSHGNCKKKLSEPAGCGRGVRSARRVFVQFAYEIPGLTAFQEVAACLSNAMLSLQHPAA
jgi:hypothetical protein